MAKIVSVTYLMKLASSNIPFAAFQEFSGSSSHLASSSSLKLCPMVPTKKRLCQICLENVLKG